MRYGRTKIGEEERERMDRSYGLSDKGTFHVINFRKEIISTAGTKIRRYNQRNLQYHHDKRQFYKELDGKMNRHIEAADPQGSTEFWSKLWSEPAEYNRDSDWLKKVKEKERTKTGYSKNVHWESIRTRLCTRILV